MMVNVRDIQFCLSAELFNKPRYERLAYVKHTISKTCPLQRPFRLRKTRISKITCRLVYVKRYLFYKNGLSSTPNTYFGQRITPSRMGRGGATSVTACCKKSPRLHENPLFKNNTLQRASRLREMHTSKIKCRLVYAKRYFIS